MKKIISILVAAMMLATVMSLIPSAATEYTCKFADAVSGEKGYKNSSFAVVSASYAISDFSIALNGQKGGWERDDDTSVGSLGTRRSLFYNLSAEAPKGTYDISVWVYDKGSVLGANGTERGILLTFAAAVTDEDSIGYNWRSDLNVGSTMVLNVHGEDCAERVESKGSTLREADLAKSGNIKTVGDMTWVEYTGKITLNANAGKVAVWSYQPAGMTNPEAGNYLYVDDIVLTPSTDNPTTADMTAVFAVIGVIACAGVVVCTSKKH